MNKSVASHIAELLENSEIGLTIGTDLFVGKEPKEPTAVVTVFDTSSEPPSNTMDAQVYEYINVQVMVRRASYETCADYSYTIANYLHLRSDDEIDEQKYKLIQLIGSPTFVDFDENNHVRFSINFRIQRSET